MTMPTSFPRSFPEVRFPWEFTEMYTKPLKYFGEPTKGMGIGAPFDGITVNTLYHKNKYEDSLRHVQERVLSNSRRQISQETGQPNRHVNLMLDRGIESRGGCMSCEPDWNGGNNATEFRNGHMNMLSPSTIEGANVLAGRGFKGGVMRTQAGAQYIRDRLTKRISELDTTDNDVNGVGSDNPLDKGELDEDDNVLADLGEFLDNLLENVSTGFFDSNSVASARNFLSGLLKVGWRVPSNQLVYLLRNLDELIQELAAASSNKGYKMSDGKKNIVKNVYTTLERARSAVDELVKNSTKSPKERKMVLQAYKPRLRRQLEAQVEAQVPGRLSGEQRNGAPLNAYVNDGSFETVFSDVAKRPAWYVELGAIPGRVRLPRRIAENIANR